MESKKIELNEKIKQIAEHLDYTSSRFADYIGISRPVMSHLFASRNKASLDIIQRILIKLPGLGIDWTFDGNELDIELLTRIANQGNVITNENDIQSSRLKKSIIKILVCHTNETFTDYKADGLSEPMPTDKHEKNTSGEPIEKVLIFYDDNTLQEFKPA